jgi:hypothetical protein
MNSPIEHMGQTYLMWRNSSNNRHRPNTSAMQALDQLAVRAKDSCEARGWKNWDRNKKPRRVTGL